MYCTIPSLLLRSALVSGLPAAGCQWSRHISVLRRCSGSRWTDNALSESSLESRLLFLFRRPNIWAELRLSLAAFLLLTRLTTTSSMSSSSLELQMYTEISRIDGGAKLLGYIAATSAGDSGVLLHMQYRVRSVCLCVGLSVGHFREPCKNSWINPDAV